VTYSFAVFVNPVAKSFGTSTTSVLFGFTLANIGTGVLGIYAGRLLMRFPIRRMMLAGLVVMAIGYTGLSAATALWQFYLLYGIVIAFGSIIVAPLGAAAIVANWFAVSRGRALTMATLGTSFGQLVMPRLAAYVIDGWGWPAAYRVFALATLIAIPIILLIVVDRPEDKGMHAYGATPDTATGSTPAVELLSNREILRRPDFWSIGVSFVLTVTVYLALMAVMVPYARTYGVTALEASELTIVMGLSAIVGKIMFATWTDRIGLRNTFWVAVALNLLACTLLATVPDYKILFVASALAGASAGGVLPLWPGLIAFRFGRHALPQVMGLMSPMVLILQGFGAPFASAMHFRPAFVVFAVMLVASAIFARNLNKAPAA
ncbi:MAG: MFS transporter, partial [Janthinobacterium lividum]